MYTPVTSRPEAETSAFSDFDRQMMRRAIYLARHGAGFTSPNPMVGAVVTAPDGRIIGEGWHRVCGSAHAEVNAIAAVGEADRELLPESTIYVTLEPCSHYGKTPPCARLLIEKRLKRVVVGSPDPFKEVAGRGIRMLREAGIRVDTFLLQEECEALNPHFLTAHRLGRPYILLKWAMTADGFIGSRPGDDRLLISNPLSMIAVHRLRSEFDAIFVGTSTVIADDPRLDTRLWPGHSPRPATFDSPRLPADAAILDRNPILRRRDETLRDFLSRIYNEEKITSMIVEGGAVTLEEYLREGIFDEIRIETSPTYAGSGIKAPRLSLAPEGIIPSVPMSDQRIGDNHVTLYRRADNYADK